MRIYSRKNILYVSINGVRRSTKLKDTKQNRKIITSQFKNDEFFNNFNIKKDDSKTLLQLCDDVLKEKETIIKASSYHSYESVYKSRIKPYFKDMMIQNVKAIDIKNFYKTFTDRSTLVSCKAILKQAFENALLAEMIKINPTNSVSIPKIESDKKSNPFTFEEMELIISSSIGYMQNVLGVAFTTGLRVGEIIALQWSNIDFENETIDIVNNHVRGRNQTPKTKSSKAIIDLPKEALIFFQNQRYKTGLRKYVFYNKWDNPIMYGSCINHNFQVLLKKIELPIRGVHQTRHTFASLKLSYGERLEWVSFMLRHKSPSFTQNVYYKYMPRKKEKRVIFDLNCVAQNTHKASISL
jgi:integrase